MGWPWWWYRSGISKGLDMIDIWLYPVLGAVCFSGNLYGPLEWSNFTSQRPRFSTTVYVTKTVVAVLYKWSDIILIDYKICCTVLAETSLYRSDADFSCLDGTIKIPFDRVNDDYCDCRDGSDEPGKGIVY